MNIYRRISSPPLSASYRLVLVGLGLATLTLSGCKKQSGVASTTAHSHDAPAGSSARDDRHDHPTPAASDHAKQDHRDPENAHGDEVTLTANAVAQNRIAIQTAELHVLRPTVIAPAQIAFNTEAMAHVGSPLRGRALEVKVRTGDFVTIGQELVVVESPELGEAQLDFLQKRTAAHAAAPSAELARIVWERARGLYEQSQGLSLTEVQRREAEYKVANAVIKTADASALSAENRLHLLGMTQSEVATLIASGNISPRYAIKAAINGRVVQREITPGEIINPDRDALMVLADTRTLWILADVHESKLMEISIGARAWVTIGSADDDKSHNFEGAVSFIGPLVDPATRTAQVRIEMPAAERAVIPGMFAQAEIVITTLDSKDPAPVVAVPEEAIQSLEGSAAVFVPVPHEPNTFASRSVTIGKRVGRFVPITGGLAAGEQFVSAGSFILKAELGKGSAAHEH